MYYHAISHLLHHFSTNCPKCPEQFVVGLILNASFRPFVSVGACVFFCLVVETPFKLILVTDILFSEYTRTRNYSNN